MIALDVETVGLLPGETYANSLRARAAFDATSADEVDRYLALSWPLAHVVSVAIRATGCRAQAADGEFVAVDRSLVDLHDGADTVLADGLRVVPCEAEDERQLLAEVARVLGAATLAPPLVTFNGSRFDLPLLVARMVAHKITPPAIILSALHQKPWESGIHVDLMSLFGHGNTRGAGSLRAWAVGLLGLDPKSEGDGHQVGALVAARDGLGLARYNLGDVRMEAALYQRWQEVVA